MSKTLYSLLLSDEVVREIDSMAHLREMSRSSLVNQILAEYASISTPESRINAVFSQIEQLLNGSRELVPFFAPNHAALSLKSSLDYKYRPTVRYEVTLSSSAGEASGELAVIFRTQSGELLNAMSGFFSLWREIEAFYSEKHTEYALYPGRFVRTISLPEGSFNKECAAQAISEYIKLFDSQMKGFLNGRYSPRDIENNYAVFIKNNAYVV